MICHVCLFWVNIKEFSEIKSTLIPWGILPLDFYREIRGVDSV